MSMRLKRGARSLGAAPGVWLSAPGDRLGQRLDDLADLFEDFPDLALTHDQRRRHRNGVADDAEHDALVVEAALHRLVAAFADAVGPRSEVDAGGQADATDVEHPRHLLERHRGVVPERLDLLAAREQVLVAVEIEGGETGGAGQ